MWYSPAVLSAETWYQSSITCRPKLTELQELPPVEPTGIEPVTSCLQNETAPQWISLVLPAHRHYPGLRQISGHWLIWAHFGWV